MAPGKKVSAKEKAAAKAEEADVVKSKEQEDREWEAAGDGKKSKAQNKKAALESSKAETQAKKAEARRLADEEAAALATKKPAAGKVTRKDIEVKRAKEIAAAKVEQEAAKLQAAREVGHEDYAQSLDNALPVNDSNTLDARNVDAALAALSVGPEQPKMKFSDYLARELPNVKQDKPGLKGPQYQDMLFKAWSRSPENPKNQKPV